MRLRNNQTGFSIVEIVIVLAVVGLIGFVGYKAYNNMQNSKTADNSQAKVQSPMASDVKAAPPISSTSDLDTALTTLDQTDPGGSNNTDTGQLDSELAAF